MALEEQEFIIDRAFAFSIFLELPGTLGMNEKITLFGGFVKKPEFEGDSPSSFHDEL